MKKLFVILLLASTVALQYCNPAKKAQASVSSVTYASNVAPIMTTNCTPCHFPPQGNKKPLDSYASVRNNIDDIINRIKKQPTERGFMPFKHARLSDSTIHVFEVWRDSGMAEK